MKRIVEKVCLIIGLLLLGIGISYFVIQERAIDRKAERYAIEKGYIVKDFGNFYSFRNSDGKLVEIIGESVIAKWKW